MSKREFLPLTDLFEGKKEFAVLSCDAMKSNESLFVLRIRRATDEVVDGLSAEGSQLTLYCAVTKEVTAETVPLTAELWEYSVSEIVREDEVIPIKWIRPKR